MALSWIWLPETHPARARELAGVARLLREYVAIFLNPRFQRLAAASAFNFAALFLFIASAPAYVLAILGLDDGQFGWFFVPMIEIGRATCRERVCRTVSLPVVAVSVKKNNH